MKVSELYAQLDKIAPFSDSEAWDNTGLLVGDMNAQVSGVLTALDCNKETVDEAIDKDLNVIVSHHPLIFSKMASVNEDSIGQIVRKLIKHDINLIAMHTNLDHQADGVSHMIAKRLGYEKTEILLQHQGNFKKLRVNITVDDKEDFKENMLNTASLGRMGDYSDVSFEYPVKGQFKPNDQANPTLGESGELEFVDEYVLEFIFDGRDIKDVVSNIYKYHPFEEPAFDIISIDRKRDSGLGVSFECQTTLDDLKDKIEDIIKRPIVNIVKANDKAIKKVGIIGGSGMSYADEAFKEGIDVLITGDVKYHEAYDAKLNGQNIIDAGHYLEFLMKDGLKELIEKNIEVEVFASEISTNPFE